MITLIIVILIATPITIHQFISLRRKEAMERRIRNLRKTNNRFNKEL